MPVAYYLKPRLSGGVLGYWVHRSGTHECLGHISRVSEESRKSPWVACPTNAQPHPTPYTSRSKAAEAMT